MGEVCLCAPPQKEHADATETRPIPPSLAIARFTLARAGRFILLFIMPIARVAPFIASAMACVDLSVCGMGKVW